MHFTGKIINGKFGIEQQTKWKRFLSGFDEGTELDIDIEKKKGKRTLTQNAYYHLYLSVISKETGDDENSLHEYFKRKFLVPVEKVVMGETIKVPASTTELNKQEFSDYLDRICALTGIPLPDPELAGYLPR